MECKCSCHTDKVTDSITYKKPAPADTPDELLQKVAQIRNDEMALYIGIGRRKDTAKGRFTLDWKVLGKNKSAGLIGQKLMSIISPLIHNFLTYDFDEWAKSHLKGK